MEIGESKDGEVVILAPAGSLNTQTSPKLEQKLLKLLEEKTRLVVIDFRGVDYLSSAALRVLLMITRRLLRAHGRLVLCTMGDDLRKVFSISGFDRDFTILQTRGEAVALAATTPPPPAKADTKAGKGPKPAAKPEISAVAEAAQPPSPPAGAPSWPFGAAPAPAAPAAKPEPPPAAVKAAAAAPAPVQAPAAVAAAASVLAYGEDGRPAWDGWPAGPAGPGVASLAEKIAATLAKGL